MKFESMLNWLRIQWAEQTSKPQTLMCKHVKGKLTIDNGAPATTNANYRKIAAIIHNPKVGQEPPTHDE